MTLLIAGLASIVMLSAATVFGLFLDAASDRARAQAAADAAALAAIAESAPGAPGDHVEQARLYTEANGAVLVSCSCAPGETSAVVTVSLDGVEARARATIDPSAFLPDLAGADPAGLDPRVAAALDRLLAASGGRVVLVSGWRSSERQRHLWEGAVARYGDPELADDWVARPGSSMHERGLAVDLGGDLELAASLVERLRLPLHRPLANEPWHFELVGAR